MAIKEKLIGIILIVVGALPFLLQIESVNQSLPADILSYLAPGEIVYQIVIIALGIWRILKVRHRIEVRR